jgi:hypothetical protein
MGLKGKAVRNAFNRNCNSHLLEGRTQAVPTHSTGLNLGQADYSSIMRTAVTAKRSGFIDIRA